MQGVRTDCTRPGRRRAAFLLATLRLAQNWMSATHPALTPALHRRRRRSCTGKTVTWPTL